VTVQVRLTEQEKRWLSDIATLEERSVSQVVRRALRDYHQRMMAGS
jgi:predicted transcriptional regulator